ncbi:hypothetical protein [Actinomadura sp. DC4]|uniref:hypothetical protein n=1 Tax=Actinomadura sp. DC4 TaxID=3055069 RepID=UPI0025B0B174|nr:hypothetical protein [Actinomadura sp. DC4]MDN3354025.1 hypothetical protein [Actinomadura sp. DC4]
MAIDTTGEWWSGETAGDIADYLEELAPGGYPVDEVVESRCAECSGTVFSLELDPSSTCARRTCGGCGSVAYMLDSEEYWMDGDDGPQTIACSCGATCFETSVGFNRREDREIRWVSIGLRCVQDGILGCCADWKIGYAPSLHLLDRT